MQKSILGSNFESKIRTRGEQGEGAKRVRTNFQIYDEFPTVKVEQVSQGEGFGKTKVDLKHQDKIPIVKVEQVKKKKSQNPNPKDDVRIRVIKKLYN